MNERNTKKLLQKYPKIFKQHKLPMSQTCMCWFFECGDGWFTIIDELCAIIENYMENERDRAKYDKNYKPCEQIEAIQVKEKFGGLRFYTNHEPNHITGAIRMAEHMSYCICEVCGSTDKVTQTNDWVSRLCIKCVEEYKKEVSR